VIDQYKRQLAIIDSLGGRGWRDHHAEGRVRHVLFALRLQGALDRAAVLDDMRGRGYDDDALRRLDRYIDKTYQMPGPDLPDNESI
jgi:hypothetical protein